MSIYVSMRPGDGFRSFWYAHFANKTDFKGADIAIRLSR